MGRIFGSSCSQRRGRQVRQQEGVAGDRRIGPRYNQFGIFEPVNRISVRVFRSVHAMGPPCRTPLHCACCLVLAVAVRFDDACFMFRVRGWRRGGYDRPAVLLHGLVVLDTRIRSPKT